MPHLLDGLAPCTEFLVLSFEKRRTNEKSQTRITLHSHLLKQLGLRPLDAGSAGFIDGSVFTAVSHQLNVTRGLSV